MGAAIDTVNESNMNRALRKRENPEGMVTVTITERDVLLLDLCLNLVDRHYLQKGTLSFEVQRLRDKLLTRPRAPDDSTTGARNRHQLQKVRKERRQPIQA